jgi:hypothetical protein
MKTQVNGIEITPKMAAVLKRWYNNTVSREDTAPFYYVEELGAIQDFFCRMIHEENKFAEIKQALFTIMDLKDDLRAFIPDNNNANPE